MDIRTLNQIENLKNQTFGVEVEMNNMVREKAAEIAAKLFGTNRYEDTRERNGYCTWSAWDAQGREWKFQKDVSIAGHDYWKCELVTPILRYNDIELLQELCRRLRKAGAKSDATRGCGIHIHVGAQGHTARTLRNLANIMSSHERLLIDALNLDSGRIDRYCRTIDPDFVSAVNEKKPETMADLADVWYTSNRADLGRAQHYNRSRYHMLNLHATFTKGTIEFRLFQFDAPTQERKNGIHAGQLKSYIQLALAISQMAKQSRCSIPRVYQIDNPKYAMRNWLNKMGLRGDEFKTAREFLTKNLTGDAAYRYGRPA